MLTRPGWLASSGPRLRLLLILALGVAAAVVTFCIPRFTDPASYFLFADQRKILGIPHFMDVVSNAPWALIGALGLVFVASTPVGGDGPFSERWERIAFAVLFGGLGLVALGSAYFHLDPTPVTLFWDRLPMTIVFMVVLTLTIGDRIDMRAGELLFPLLLALGFGSVLYWRYTETIGTGDVRLYLLVQYFTMFALPVMVFLFPPRYTRGADLIAALGLYGIAKLFELADTAVFAATRAVSGHTLKHLAGGFAAAYLLRIVRLRRPVAEATAMTARAAG